MEVEIISRKSVKPSSPTPHHVRNHNLSFIDAFNYPAYINILLYYPIAGEATNHVEENLKSRNQLEKSLSETLTVYYPLAGRFIKEEVLVDCNDEGVSYLEAQVNGELSQILDGTPNAKVLDKFIPSDVGEVDSTTTPLLVVQVNSFRCGGIVIAVQFGHRVADGACIVGFINAWATVSRLGIGEVIRPDFELASHIPARSFQGPQCDLFSFANYIITKRFLFEGGVVSAMKVKAQQQATRAQVVMAVLWKAMIRVVQAKGGHKKTWFLKLTMNLRSKTAPPMPNNCFGNFYTFAHAQFRGDANTVEWQDLVAVVGDEIRKTLEDCKKPLHGDEFRSVIADSYSLIDRVWGDEEVDFRMCTSWCWLPMYEADFGWGMPCWISSVSLPVEAIILMDTRNGDGIEAWVSLNKQDMVEFRKDQDIITFSSC